MITYNHEDFIKEAIFGILGQKFSFEFEFIIANDASSDGTDNIIEQIIKSHPQVNFRYFNNASNKGMAENFLFALSECSGKYIALCEGDDFWTDPLKLQKQVDFLENNPDFEMCFTNINIINSRGEITTEKLIANSQKNIFLHKDMPTWAPTLTRVFKNRDFTSLNKNALGMDTLMMVYQSTLGKIKFIDEVTGTYRVHDQGVYASIGKARKKEHNIQTFLACLPIVQRKLVPKFVGLILKLLLELKRTHKGLYIKNKKSFFNKKAHLEQLNNLERFKIELCAYLITIPRIEKSKLSLNFTKKIINKLLVY